MRGASFIGFAPADNPKIAVAVVIDEPRPYYFGGIVSAPAFKNICESVLRYLETQPSLTVKLDPLDKNIDRDKFDYLTGLATRNAP